MTRWIRISIFIYPFLGQAEEVARSTDNLNEKYSGFIIISGDGLVHEVVNGLAQRPDWNEISKIPFGIIPGGSGNALNCSILHQLGMYISFTTILLKLSFQKKKGEIWFLGQPLDGLNNLGSTWSALNSAIGAEQNNFLPFDLMEIELHNGQKSISFLGITIGLVADVDLGIYLYYLHWKFYLKNQFRQYVFLHSFLNIEKRPQQQLVQQCILQYGAKSQNFSVENS